MSGQIVPVELSPAKVLVVGHGAAKNLGGLIVARALFHADFGATLRLPLVVDRLHKTSPWNSFRYVVRYAILEVVNLEVVNLEVVNLEVVNLGVVNLENSTSSENALSQKMVAAAFASCFP